MSATIRIGAGAGFAYDRIDPAVDLARRGELDFLVFECLAERTLAHGHLERRRDAGLGYNPLLELRLEAVMPACRENGTCIVTNMGSANPAAALEAARRTAAGCGLTGSRLSAVFGDDVMHLVSDDTILTETGGTIGDLGLSPIAANAYLGADAVGKALDDEPDLIITGRVADPSLFVAPLAHRFGWAQEDWTRLAAATMVGHLLECAGQLTGGYFADPPYKEVPDMMRLGFPLAEVGDDGSAVVTKLDGTGGCVTPLCVKEQLLYEIHDPANYVTPDVVADFSRALIEEHAANRIHVAGAAGKPRPDTLKVTVGFDSGFLVEAGVSYAGLAAYERALLARDIIAGRMRSVHGMETPLRIDIIGASSLHAGAACRAVEDARDVRLHAAMRTRSMVEARMLLIEVESIITCGPAGGAGFRGSIVPAIATYSTFLDRNLVSPRVETVVV